MIEKKKILVCIDWFLPGFRAGGPVSSCAGLVEHLASEFDFYIVCRDTDYTLNEPYVDVQANCWIKRGEGIFVYYISRDQLRLSTFQSIMEKVQPHRVYLNSMFSLWFTLVPLWFCKREKRIAVLASRGMLAPGALAVKALKKYLFLKLANTFGLFDAVVFQASTAIEEKQIRSIFPKSSVKIAPNLPRKTSQKARSQKPATSGGLRLINIARIAPEKNLLGAIQILKSVKCSVTFDFYGPVYDTAYWKECQQHISSLPNNIKVNYRGAIDPNDIITVLSQQHFLFMPTLGENFGHIIFESMQVGTPVIISNRTPWTGLVEKNAGWDISLDNQKQFVETIEQCATMDVGTYAEWQEGAKRVATAFMAKSDAIELNRKLFS